MGVLVSSASASVLRNAVLSAFAIFNSDDQAPPPVAVEEIGGGAQEQIVALSDSARSHQEFRHSTWCRRS
jgi:hypothetical protein